uniref:Uncharacterized protein n=1 Tax=Arundo donax TaxID=35708 RepID=A0A0A9AXH8_ARUDO
MLQDGGTISPVNQGYEHTVCRHRGKKREEIATKILFCTIISSYQLQTLSEAEKSFGRL